jgi:hypothetical protein
VLFIDLDFGIISLDWAQGNFYHFCLTNSE